MAQVITDPSASVLRPAPLSEKASAQLVRTVLGGKAQDAFCLACHTAELAAAGHSDRDIAQALFITTNTVEIHLTATYDKLGINGRANVTSPHPPRHSEPNRGLGLVSDRYSEPNCGVGLSAAITNEEGDRVGGDIGGVGGSVGQVIPELAEFDVDADQFGGRLRGSRGQGRCGEGVATQVGVAPRSQLDRLNRDPAGHFGDLGRHLGGPLHAAPDLPAAHLRVRLAG